MNPATTPMHTPMTGSELLTASSSQSFSGKGLKPNTVLYTRPHTMVAMPP